MRLLGDVRVRIRNGEAPRNVLRPVVASDHELVLLRTGVGDGLAALRTLHDAYPARCVCPLAVYVVDEYLTFDGKGIGAGLKRELGAIADGGILLGRCRYGRASRHVRPEPDARIQHLVEVDAGKLHIAAQGDARLLHRGRHNGPVALAGGIALPRRQHLVAIVVAQTEFDLYAVDARRVVGNARVYLQGPLRRIVDLRDWHDCTEGH